MTVTRQDFEDAVTAYWGAKQTQNELSKIKDKVGAGTAGSVRGGKHFDSIAALIAKFFLEAGYPAEDIRVTKSQRLELPGYYRPQKQWDLVVAHENTLVAAFELKGGVKRSSTRSPGRRCRTSWPLTSSANVNGSTRTT